MKYSYKYETEIGILEIAEEDNKIIKIGMQDNKNKSEYINKETDIIKRAYTQIQEYLNGKRKQFELPLKIEGTPFQEKVWKELLKIPYGQTATYGEIANKVGNKKAARAVGMANNRNNIMIVIPCHRVIGANNKLVGYACGLDIKEKLLNIEKSNMEFNLL